MDRATRKVTVINEDGTEITYQFQLETAEDVCRMLISAGGVAMKQEDHHVASVLVAQAEMIEQGLHVRGVNAPDMMLDIEAFHQKFGLEYLGKPRMLPPELFSFRSGFMEEELTEWRDEQPKLIDGLTGGTNGESDHRQIAHGLEQQLDALVDLVYVALGTAYLQFGIEVFHEAWKRVQTANMAKVRAEKKEDSKRDSTFDVVKPAGWTPPDHHDLVKDHAHIPFRMGGGEMNEAHPDPKPIA